MPELTPFQQFIRQCLLYPLASPFLPPEAKVEKDFSYAAGQKIGTLEPGVACDYPAESDVRCGVEYDNGLKIGTYNCTPVGELFTMNNMAGTEPGVLLYDPGLVASDNNGPTPPFVNINITNPDGDSVDYSADLAALEAGDEIHIVGQLADETPVDITLIFASIGVNIGVHWWLITDGFVEIPDLNGGSYTVSFLRPL